MPNDGMKLVNPGAWDDYNGQKLWRIDAQYSDPIYVFAPNEQDALDETVDESDFLDYLQMSADELDVLEKESKAEDGRSYEPEADGFSALGNASEYFNTDLLIMRSLGAVTAADMLTAYLAKEK